MPPRWKPPKEDRVDEESVRRERVFQQDLSDVLEYGTEEDFVAMLKMHKPNMEKEELRMLIKQFRVYVREKRGLC
jgi:hypothetical protein